MHTVAEGTSVGPWQKMQLLIFVIFKPCGNHWDQEGNS